MRIDLAGLSAARGPGATLSGDKVQKACSESPACVQAPSAASPPNQVESLLRLTGGLATSGRRLLAFGLHFGGVIRHQLLRNGAGREPPVRNLGNCRHLGRAAGDEAFGELR